MVKIPSWEVKQFQASQETAHILWNPTTYNEVHGSLQLVPIQNQNNPEHSI